MIFLIHFSLKIEAKAEAIVVFCRFFLLMVEFLTKNMIMWRFIVKKI